MSEWWPFDGPDDFEECLIREQIPYLKAGAFYDPSAPARPRLSNGQEIRQGTEVLVDAGVPLKSS